MPDHEAAIGRSDQQAVVHAMQLAGNLLGENHAHDQAEAPVEPAGHGRNARDEGDGAGRRLGQ